MIEAHGPSGFHGRVWNETPQARAVARARFFLADDHDMLLDAFRRLIEPEFTVVPRELMLAIRTALSGNEYVRPALALNDDSVGEGDADDPADISPRGREVLKLLACGRTMKETAARLGITPRTVAFHKYRMMHQLSLRSSAELVQFAVRRRIV